MGRGGNTLASLALFALAGCAARQTPAPLPRPHDRVTVAHDDAQPTQGAAQSPAASGSSAQGANGAKAAPAKATRLSAAAAYRARVEHRAFQRGVRIIWIHPPRDERAKADPTTDMTPPTEPFRYQPSVFR